MPIQIKQPRSLSEQLQVIARKMGTAEDSFTAMDLDQCVAQAKSLEAQVLDLEAGIQRATAARARTQQWYAVRWERLKEWARAEDYYTHWTYLPYNPEPPAQTEGG